MGLRCRRSSTADMSAIQYGLNFQGIDRLYNMYIVLRLEWIEKMDVQCTLYPHASIVKRLEINVGEVKLGFTDLNENPSCLF